MKTRYATLLAAVAVAGCASVDPYGRAPISEHLQRHDTLGSCARLFRESDARVERSGARDAQEPRVVGFPYLRVDRFTASLADDAAKLTDGFGSWSDLMARLDRNARSAERSNAGDAGDAKALDECRDRLAAADGPRLELLRGAARVRDDYSLALRALGLYPLTRLAFAAGIRGWQADVRATFAAALAGSGEQGAVVRYRPDAIESSPAVPPSSAFGLPALPAARWRELLLRNAPRLEVETASGDDRIGRLQWRRDDAGDAARIGVDTGQPVAYARIAFARFAGRIVPQLVYTFWFPARTARSRWDPYAGAIDGITWRSTQPPCLSSTTRSIRAAAITSSSRPRGYARARCAIRSTKVCSRRRRCRRSALATASCCASRHGRTI